jgi:hypothetical protein
MLVDVVTHDIHETTAASLANLVEQCNSSINALLNFQSLGIGGVLILENPFHSTSNFNCQGLIVVLLH